MLPGRVNSRNFGSLRNNDDDSCQERLNCTPERLSRHLATPSVSINDRSDNDKALLDFAAEQNQVVIARYLLEHGAAVDAKATSVLALGVTALDRTAYFGSVDVAELLIAHGANVNPTGVAAPPLLFAASGGRMNVIKLLLLAHGADLSYQTGAGQTALSEAAAAGTWISCAGCRRAAQPPIPEH